MKRHRITVEDRLGWLAYLTVMGGGVPDLQLLFADLDGEEAPEETGVSELAKEPAVEAVRYEAETSREREEIAAA